MPEKEIKMFSDEDKLKFKKFNQNVTESPRFMEDQPHERKGHYLWCEDWEIIELNKYFFNGREAYFGDPPPNRLRGNPLFDKEKIAEKAEDLIAKLQTADNIISALKQRRTHA